jgi:hypothetical protein
MQQETKHDSTNLVVVKIRSSPSFNRDSGANRCGPAPSTVGGWTLILFSDSEAFSIFFRSHFHLQDECSTECLFVAKTGNACNLFKR